MSDLDQYKNTEPKTNTYSDTKSINYYSIFENYKSNPVRRSTSLNSLKRYKNTRPSHLSDDERSVRSMTDGFEYKSNSNFELPLEVIKQLERHSLHGNLKRDSFRSRSGTKNFVLNPIFDERFESEGDDEVFDKSIEIHDNVKGNENGNDFEIQGPNSDDYIETVYTDLNNLESGRISSPDPFKRSKSLKSNQISSPW